MAITQGYNLGGDVRESIGKLSRMTANLKLDGTQEDTYVAPLKRITDIQISPIMYDYTDSTTDLIGENSRDIRVLGLAENETGSGDKNKIYLRLYNTVANDEIVITVTGY